MKHCHSPLSRLLTLVLAVVMLFGVMSVGVNAATIKNVKHYDTYLCLGDSIAAGYGPYEGYPKCLGFERMDVAYHAIVADAVQCSTLYPLGRTGFRTQEIRYMLEQGYEGDEYLFQIANLKPEVVAEWKPVFEKAAKDADLITLNVGSNDVMNYAFLRATLAGRTTESDSELAKYISDALTGAGDMGAGIQKMIDAAKTAGMLPAVVSAFVSGLFEGYQHFRQNWDPMIRDIYDANPDVTLVVVGMYNPLKNAKLTDASLLTIGRAFDTLVNLMNLTMQTSRYAQKYLYADVTQTEIFQLDALTNPNFSTTMIKRVHPTEEGHQFMATQIISLLPVQGTEPSPAPTTEPSVEPTEQPVKEFPFTDVPGDAWFYPDVYYAWDQGLMNGKDAKTFDPNGTTTRAEFATVLWRLAGSPAVTAEQKAACPFTDLAADWYKDAVVWAYDAKVVNGMSADTFAPNEKITREQMVTMLCRYSGETDNAADLSKITDADAISDYAKPAVAWAVVSGIVNGFPDGSFQPKGSATRAQMAAIMARFDRAK